MRIYYPFHPRAGELLEVVAHQPNYGGYPALVVRGACSSSSWIPEWMAHPAAAHLTIHDPPRLPLECLRALRHVLDVVLATAVPIEDTERP